MFRVYRGVILPSYVGIMKDPYSPTSTRAKSKVIFFSVAQLANLTVDGNFPQHRNEPKSDSNPKF